MKIKTTACILLILLVSSITDAQLKELTADNGIIKVKLDLTRGGAIKYLSLSNDDRNLVNIHDEGRYIQQSYYAGKSLDRKNDGQSPHWSPWSWNPIQVGDAFGNRAQILDSHKGDDTLYVKLTPMLWDMNNEPAEAVMEQWTILKNNILEVHNKLICFRTDTIYGENIARSQELPAVYPISDLDKLFCYIGELPFTNDTLSNPTVIKLSSGFWGRYNNVTEHWMAFIGNDFEGYGVYNPQCTMFLAGMSGKPGHESADASTSYIAPIKKEVLNKTSKYEYTYYIIVGSIDKIRADIYDLNKIESK